MAKSQRKISKSFIGFLFVSFLIWTLITLSKKYTSSITYPVEFKNLPQNKLLQEEPIKELNIDVYTTGFKLITSKIKPQKIIFDASNIKLAKGYQHYLPPNFVIESLEKQLTKQIEIKRIEKDSIFLQLGTLASKKIPLKPNLDIKYHIGYDLLESVDVKPDSITVSGPKSILDTLQFLELSKVNLTDVKSDFKVEATILMSNKNVKLDNKKVQISGKVDKFTEGNFNLSYNILNLPTDTELTSLTKSIEVVYVVALSKFEEVTEASFEIICDYETTAKNNLNYLIPKLVKKPKFIKSYKLIPNQIDFLIKK